MWQNHGNVNVPYLDNIDDRRKLNLNWNDNDWSKQCRFLVFRNSLYSPLFLGGVFFFDLLFPPSEHFSRFGKRSADG